ncbi:hypothetical protein V5T82_17930, partial [Magnetovibrio sp. PR-2]|uniref:hypothetical protein n=1 Tax=Magnetovibrio sp. PR-2 TaxID=3120356 RepID=UPI002FCE4589
YHTIRRHLAHDNHSEVVWCLLVGGFIGYKFRKVDLPKFGTPPNAVVFTIMGLLRERKILPFPLDEWKWRPVYKSTGILSENWLPMYEAVRRGWTKDKRLVAAVSSDPIFRKMLAYKVTFLNETIFDSSLSVEGSDSYKVEEENIEQTIDELLKVLGESVIKFSLKGYDDPDEELDVDF